MQTLTQTFIVFLHSFAAWSGLAVYFLLARGFGQASGLPRLAFVLGHYLLIIILFSGVYYFYFNYFGYFSTFATMAIALVSVFVVELIVFNFFYSGELWFLNFADYIVPVFLAAGSVYFVGKNFS
ncbi:MAG: hypothetical protein ABEJ24_02615 [Candidatus Magasanikbacteria bacterium]